MRGSSTHLPTLTGEASTWKGSHVLSVTQMDLGGLRLLFRVSQEMRTLVRSKGGDNRLAHRLLATVFYEASTRTSCSFQAAMQRLGGSHIHVDGGKGSNTSASKKGESLQDTVRCLECYTDLTVLRHPIKGTLAQVAAASEKPVINAGDGVGEHPTQALLDVFTIYDELKLKRLPSRRLTVVLLGDLKHGRTVHSLVLLLAASKGLIWTEELILRYCSPGALRMPHEIQKFVADTAPDVVQEMYSSLTEACEGDIPVNVLYVTRIQKERFESEKAYNEVKGVYVVDSAFMKVASPDMIVMHPLPRVDEIHTDVDQDPRAAYFRQMENGMFVRMALLALVLGKAGNSEERREDEAKTASIGP